MFYHVRKLPCQRNFTVSSWIAATDSRQPLQAAHHSLPRRNRMLAATRNKGYDDTDTSWSKRRAAMSSLRGPLILAGLACLVAASNAPTAGPPVRPVRVDCFGDPLPAGAVVRLGTVQLRQPQGLSVIALSPDGKLLATGGRGKQVRLHDTTTGKEIRRLAVPGYRVLALAFSPDGKKLAWTEQSGGVRLYEVTGKLLHSFSFRFNGAPVLAFSPNGKVLASTGDNGVTLMWSAETGEELLRFKPLERRVNVLAFAADGKSFVIGSVDDPVIRFYSPSGRFLHQMRRTGRDSGLMALSANGRILASGIYSESIRLWDLEACKELTELKPDSRVESIALPSDGKTIAFSTRDGPIRIHDTSTGNELRRLDGPGGGCHLAVSDDGKTLAGGFLTVHLWDVATGKDRFPSRGHESGINALGFSRDGATVTSFGDRALRTWDARTGKELRRVTGLIKTQPKDFFVPGAAKGGQPLAAAEAAMKGLLLVNGYLVGQAADRKELLAHLENEKKVYDVLAGVEWRRVKGHTNAQNVVLSPDGKILAVKDPARLRLLDAETGKELRRLAAAQGPTLAFSPDSKLLVCHGVATLEMWDVARGDRLRELDRIFPPFLGRIDFAPGGRTLSTWSGHEFVLWDAPTGRLLFEKRWDKEGITVSRFAPNGRTIALGTSDHTVRLLDSLTGQEIRRWSGHEDTVTSLAFSPDGRRLVSGSWAGNGLVWEVAGAAAPPAEKEVAGLWSELGGKDARRADRAFWILASAPRQAVALVRQKFTGRLESTRVRFLLAELDNDQFDLREWAELILLRMGGKIVPALRRTLARKPSPEVRRRIERILAKLGEKREEPPAQELSPEEMLGLRAVWLLEQIGDKEAWDVLEKLAEGIEAPALATTAEAVLERMRKRK
jgi:WD40 repeat protein